MQRKAPKSYARTVSVICESIGAKLALIESFAGIASQHRDPDACLALIAIAKSAANEISLLYTLQVGTWGVPRLLPADVQFVARVATREATLAEIASRLGSIARAIGPKISARATRRGEGHELVPALLAWLPVNPCGPDDHDLERTIRYVANHP
jgi:hypothetical protein